MTEQPRCVCPVPPDAAGFWRRLVLWKDLPPAWAPWEPPGVSRSGVAAALRLPRLQDRVRARLLVGYVEEPWAPWNRRSGKMSFMSLIRCQTWMNVFPQIHQFARVLFSVLMPQVKY